MKKTGKIKLEKIGLRKAKKDVYIAANKVDNTKLVGVSSEFWSFGVGDVYDISATNGSGTGELFFFRSTQSCSFCI